MKYLRNVTSIIKDNSGETIAEVLVAFVLLTIVLILYAQGIALATNSDMNASKSRTGADKAMKQVQDDIAAGNNAQSYQVQGYFGDRVIHNTYTYTIDGQTYTYVYYDYEPI